MTLTGGWAVTLAVGALALAGCANDGGTDAGASSTATGADTVASTGADAGQAGSAPGDRPTTAATSASAPSTTRTPATVPTSTGTAPELNPFGIEESNCAPGPGALPDGLWFGFYGGPSDEGLEFDLACWFTGEPANAAAAADGKEPRPPNDYYIRNTNQTLRRVPLAPDSVTVSWIPDLGNPTHVEITYPQWISERVEAETYYVPPIWITVKDGAVVTIFEQWAP